MQTTNLTDPAAIGGPVAEPHPDGIRTAVAPALAPRRSGSRFALPSGVRTIFRSRKATAGLILMAIFILVAIFAPRIAPGDPTDFVARPSLPPSGEYLLGTTQTGQDVFAQTVWGARLPLKIGAGV